MCAHPLHTALRAGGDALRQATGSLSCPPLSLDSLRCAVWQTRQLTARLADLADALADHAQALPVDGALSDTRSDSTPPAETMREIVADLRIAARHLRTGCLLLEPTDADLAHLRTQPSPAPARSAGHVHRDLTPGTGSAGHGGHPVLVGPDPHLPSDEPP